MMKRLILAASLLSCLWACSGSDPDTAGATSETTNGIAVTVLDAANKPVPQARVTLYSKQGLAVVGSARADAQGVASFGESSATCMDDGTLAGPGCFVEGIAGEDSSLMSWSSLDAKDSSAEVTLLPSASLTVRTGAAQADFANLFETLALDSTPYAAALAGGEYVFAHVPAGVFSVVAGDSVVATVSLEDGVVADTLFRVPDVTRELVFEDFDDGDSLNNIAAGYLNYGWYFSASKGASWTKPDSSGFSSALKEDSSHGKFLATDFALGDSGYVLMGTRLGLDTTYYDLSGLTAIRLTVRGDCEFRVALEHYLDVGDNNFRKALWLAKASDGWTDVVLRPGNELLDESSYQVSWDEVSKEIGLFSIFITSGTHLEIDKIVFEGVNLR